MHHWLCFEAGGVTQTQNSTEGAGVKTPDGAHGCLVVPTIGVDPNGSKRMSQDAKPSSTNRSGGSRGNQEDACADNRLRKKCETRRLKKSIT